MSPSATTAVSASSATAHPTKDLLNGTDINKPLHSTTIESSVLHRSLVNPPCKVIGAKGIELYLEDGRTVIDACGGAAVALIGHGNEEVANAVMEQMKIVSYVHTLAYTTDSAEELAQFMLEGTPFEKAYFVSSGSEAVDAALKLARQYWFEQGENGAQRTHYISRQQGYHGNTVGAMSISANAARKIPYANLQVPNMSTVSPANAYRYQSSSESEEEYVSRLAAELEGEILRVGSDKVIAFVAETVVGATTGCVPPPKGYFKAISAVCKKYDVLVILDEIMSGTGRSGTMFSFEQDDMTPDMVVVGKGLGGGYAPLSAVYVNSRIVNGLRRGTSAFNHGHTYQAHPVACAAALAVQKIVRREQLIENCARMGKVLEEKLKSTFADSKHVGNIRGRGLFWGLEFVRDKKTKQPFPRSLDFANKVQQAAFALGVAVHPNNGTADGVDGDHVLFAPPYNVTESQLDTIVKTLKQAYDSEAALLGSIC